MQSNGIIKSSALTLEMSVSPAVALGVLEQKRRQPAAKYCSFPSAFLALQSAVVACQRRPLLPFPFPPA